MTFVYLSLAVKDTKRTSPRHANAEGFVYSDLFWDFAGAVLKQFMFEGAVGSPAVSLDT